MMENMELKVNFAAPAELFKTLSGMTAAGLSQNPELLPGLTAHVADINGAAQGIADSGEADAKDEGVCARVVQERGRVFSAIDDAFAKTGAFAGTLTSLMERDSALKARIEARFAEVKRGFLGEILTAIPRSALVVYVPMNVRLDGETLLDVVASGENFTDALNVWLWLEDGAEASISLNLSSRNGTDETLTIMTLTAIIGRNAALRLHEIQNLNAHGYSLRDKTMIVDADGSVDWVTVESGSSRSTSDLSVDLAGDNASVKVNGIFFAADDQRLTMNTRQAHHGKNTYSSLLYKGAVANRARAVWTGMIYVDPNATGTDGYQKNDNLMLSPDARVFARPGLEIVTDDVKCSHGTTMTEIDPNQVFYLMSRGISEKDARTLIIEGFFDEILDNLSVETIRETVRAQIRSKFE